MASYKRDGQLCERELSRRRSRTVAIQMVRVAVSRGRRAGNGLRTRLHQDAWREKEASSTLSKKARFSARLGSTQSRIPSR